MNNLAICLKGDENFRENHVYEATNAYNGMIDIVANGNLCTVDLDDKDFVFLINPTLEITNLLLIQYKSSK